MRMEKSRWTRPLYPWEPQSYGDEKRNHEWTHLTEKPWSEAPAPAQPFAAGASLDKDTGDAPSLGLQGVWPPDSEDGRHSRDFMTADDSRLLME